MGLSAPAAEDALDALHALARPQLLALADAVASGQLGSIAHPAVVERLVPKRQVAQACRALDWLAGAGAPPAVVAAFLRGIARERAGAERMLDRISLVWTGPALPGAESRDTAVVVDELFSQAHRRVLVVGFVVHGGREVFAALAARMAAVPELDVRLCLNIAPSPAAPRDERSAVAAFRARFLTTEWPGGPTPTLYYDPRTFAADATARGVLHAKCVVVDDEVAFVTSANLTGAAQHRNIEAGVLVRDPAFAGRLRQQFDTLIAAGLLRAM